MNDPTRLLVLLALGISSATSLDAKTVQDGIRMQETAAAWGLDFTHHTGAAGRRYLPETMGAGVVILDFDGDGDEDVFFVDGGPLPGSPESDYRSRLFRNDGGARFVDFTDRSGLETMVYGTGATAGDIDNDGDLDLYVTAYGRNLLLVNQGNGVFRDGALEAGVADESWGSSAAFADPDRDGDLDLYLSNYVDFTPADRTPCRQQGIEVYCHPGQYEGAADRYFRNLGNGRFEDWTTASGLAFPSRYAGLGVAFADFDDDGWPDLYVANDADPNFLFLNKGNGTFEEAALLSGVAYGDTGRPEAGMGIALGDTDGDQRVDVFVTNFELETNALYRNLGGGLFSDVRFASNVAEASLMSLAFGAAFADLDHDADLDLVVANGHILDNANEFHERSRYAQPNQIFENDGSGSFREVRAVDDAPVRVSRGLAVGDLDRDGDLDVAISNAGAAAEVYENRRISGNWLQVDLHSVVGESLGIGARITVEAAGRRQVREIRTGSSYLSQSATAAHFGLAGADRVADLEVRWPSGRQQRYRRLPAGRRLRLE